MLYLISNYHTCPIYTDYLSLLIHDEGGASSWMWDDNHPLTWLYWAGLSQVRAVPLLALRRGLLTSCWSCNGFQSESRLNPWSLQRIPQLSAIMLCCLHITPSFILKNNSANWQTVTYCRWMIAKICWWWIIWSDSFYCVFWESRS